VLRAYSSILEDKHSTHPDKDKDPLDRDLSKVMKDISKVSSLCLTLTRLSNNSPMASSLLNLRLRR
jgi:hypothetical protein